MSLAQSYIWLWPSLGGLGLGQELRKGLYKTSNWPLLTSQKVCLATKFPYQQEIVPLNLQDDPSLYVWLAPSFLRPHLGLTNGQWGAGKTSKYNCKVNCRCNSFSPFKASEADQDPLVGLKCTTFVPILCKTNFCGFEIEVGKYFFKIYYSRRYAENESYFSYFPTTRQCTFLHQNTFLFLFSFSQKSES